MPAALLFDPFLARIGFFDDSLCPGFKLQWHNSHMDNLLKELGIAIPW
jgi:hypothetical protein